MTTNRAFYFTTLYFLNISVYCTRQCGLDPANTTVNKRGASWTTGNFQRTTALHGVKDWWFNVVPRATGCSTVLNNAAGNRQVAHARSLQAQILLCYTGVCCCHLLRGFHSGWGFFLTREWLPAWQKGLCSLELIGKRFHETDDTNKIIMFKFILRKYVRAMWNLLD